MVYGGKYAASGRKRDFSIVGRTLYKLDVSWPKYSEHFTGQVFGVAVNHLAGMVYVAQVRLKHAHVHRIDELPQKCFRCIYTVFMQRGENIPKVLVFSTDGDFIQAWNTSTLEMPHGIFLSNASGVPSVWITDVGNGEFMQRFRRFVI